VKALEQDFVSLIEQFGLNATEVAFALLPYFLDDKARLDRITDNGWLQKPATLFHKDKAFEPISGIRRTKRGKTGQQETVRERLPEPGLLGVFDVIVDRMDVTGDAGEQKKMSVGQSLRRPFECLSDLQRHLGHGRNDRIN
jgi:hypothetical protein